MTVAGRSWRSYTRVSSRGEARIRRPQLTVLVQAGTVQLQAIALVDSGSDQSVLPPSLAEALGITPLRSIEPLDGIGGVVPAGIARADLRITLDPGTLFLPSIPFRVPLAGDRPEVVILGRAPLFEAAQITFEDWAERFAIQPRRDSPWLFTPTPQKGRDRGTLP